MINQHENDIDLCLQFSIMKVLLSHRDLNQLRDIQKLYEAANITTRQLVYRFKEIERCPADPKFQSISKLLRSKDSARCFPRNN